MPTKSPDPAVKPASRRESGKKLVDNAVKSVKTTAGNAGKAVKANPKTSAGIAAGVAVAAVGAAYGVKALKAKTPSSRKRTGEKDDIIDPQRVPEKLPK